MNRAQSSLRLVMPLVALLAGCDLMKGCFSHEVRGSSVAAVGREGLDAARGLEPLGGYPDAHGFAGLRGARLGDDVAGTPFESEPPIAVYSLRADSVRSATGRPFASLVHDPSYYLYPLRIGAEIASCLRIDRDGGDYVMTAVGGTNTIRLAIADRRELALQTSVAPNEVFLIEVPALNRTMVATRVSGQILTIPLQNDSGAVVAPTPLDIIGDTIVAAAKTMGQGPR